MNGKRLLYRMTAASHPVLCPAAPVSQPIRRQWLLLVCLLFPLVMAAQALCYLALGTGWPARGLSACGVAVTNAIPLFCSWVAWRRARGVAAIFWLLFGLAVLNLLIPNIIMPHDALLRVSTVSAPTLSLLYCLYGAPVMMILFLPDSQARFAKAEIALDFVQITVVIALVYSTFFFLPLQSMTPGEALLHNVIISNWHSIFLLVATVLRLLFARTPQSRDLFRRLAIFLFACVATTVAGDWIDQHHYEVASAWYDLGWDLTFLPPALVALTWTQSGERATRSAPAPFLPFLTFNLVLVAMLSGMQLMTSHWKAAHGTVLTSIAVAASLVAFTFRLALTQYHQHREIVEREAAEESLKVANGRIGSLLAHTQRQVEEITQVSELSCLLQACTSTTEVYRVIPERMERLFRGYSGYIALLNESRTRVETVAAWGPNPPSQQAFVPEECWALRRGSPHVSTPGSSALSCAHFPGGGTTICIPLIANGHALGTFALQDGPGASAADSLAQASAWQRQVMSSLAEDIALAIANLGLREELRRQAIRDPLTGLYNRRYMQEFLDRELSRAARRSRSVAVLMVDLDHFKLYNDTYGHGAGDQALAGVGEVLLRSVRAEDLACRYGGEEFCVILTECPLEQAVKRATEIRQRIRQCRLQRDDRARDPLTTSIGVAAFAETTDRGDLLLKFADEALYQAKRNGRDCVVAAKPASVAFESASPIVEATKKSSAAG